VSGVGSRISSLSQNLVLDLAPLYVLVAIVILIFARSAESALPAGVLAGTTIAIVLLSLPEGLRMTSRFGIGSPEVIWGIFAFIFYGGFQISSLWLLHRSKVNGHNAAALWLLGGGLIAAPLAIVSPSGPRNFFITAIFTLASILIVVGPKVNSARVTRQATKAVFVAFGIVVSLLLGATAANKAVFLSNVTTAKALYEEGAEKIELQTYPFESLIHGAYNGKKFLAQLQGLECVPGDCSPMREVEVEFK
jgi:hypothetical protein